MNIEVSFVVIHYKNSDLTLKCIANIEESCDHNALTGEIIVVDNSQDFDANLLICHQSAKLIKNEKNLGFARANNMGILVARGKFLVLLNNDAFMTAKVLQSGLKYLKNRKDVGLWAPALRFEDGLMQKSFSRLPTLFQLLDEYFFFNLFKKMSEKFFGVPHSKQILSVQSVIGACWFLSRDTVKRIGLLDGDFFFTSEDTEYCLRIFNLGLHCVVDSRESIIHLGSASQKHNLWSNDPFLHDARKLFFNKFTTSGTIASLIIRLGLLTRKLVKM